MPLAARRYLRKMRGGAQAHLIEAADGNAYVVKFRNNPQHRRVLVNEWIGCALLKYLRLPVPEPAVIELGAEFLRQNPEVSIQAGSQRQPVPAGWHYGSRYPGDPESLAVYDFVPDALLGHVVNLADFLGVLVLDKWAGNSNGRQAVFYNARLRHWPPREDYELGFVASMIDHGYLFNGPYWDFPDGPLQGLYHRSMVYQAVRSVESFEPWIGMLENLPEEVLDQARKGVPYAWLEDDEDELDALLERLYARRRAAADLILRCRQVRPALFPRWN